MKWMHPYMWKTSKHTFSQRMLSVVVKRKNHSFFLVMLENIGLIIQSDIHIQEIKLKLFTVESSSSKMGISLL